MTRAPLALVFAAAACTQGSGPARPTNTAAPAPKVIGADPGDRVRDDAGQIRPEATAGLYWHPYVTCDDCAVPAAVVAYVAPDAAAARAIVAALEGRLRLGLPWVIHTDHLGAGLGGVAVVTGTFSTREAADRAAAGSDPIGGVAPRVIAIEGAYGPDTPRHVTVIDRGGPVAAWSQADIRAVDQAMSESDDPDAQQTMKSQARWFARELAKRPPACTVQPGELFVVEERELYWYRYAPVRCGDRPAYVPWTSTLLGHAALVPDGTGGHRLFQIVGAECDSPIIEEWRYDRDGRHPLTPEDSDGPQLALGGC